MKAVRSLLGLMVFFALLGGSVCLGQDAPGEDVGSSRGRKKIDIDEVRIVGRIVKPQVQFMISREKGKRAEALVLRESFLPKIADSVSEPPF